MRELAFDVAGSATGWAFGVNRQLLNWGKYISNVRQSRGQRLYEFACWLDELLQKYQPDVVLIEKPFLGRNSNVLANLSRFTAIVEMQVYETLDLKLDSAWFIDPKVVKKLLKVKKSVRKRNMKEKHADNKRLMVQRINKLYGLKLRYKKGKSKKYNDDDIADSIALLHAWWLIQSKE
jgi:Holliday junction resolvasome RuvABC endonuclease subunit